MFRTRHRGEPSMFRTRRRREPPAPILKKGLFERVAAYQQTALLLGGIAYVFGYLSRALNALENNLGALPGVRFEYLVGGTLLLIPPVALCLFFWGVWRSAKMLAAWAAEVSGRKERVSRALLVAFVLAMIVGIVGDGRISVVGMIIFSSTIIYFFIFQVVANESSSPSSATIRSESVEWWQKGLSWIGKGALYVWSAVLVLLSGVFLLLLFVLAVGYGSIALKYVPQELGGVKPKCGVFDLSPEQLSPELRSLIVSGDHLDPSSKVIRSRSLEVFTTSEPWLIRMPGPADGVPARSIRLDGKAVLSVEWCP